MKLCGHLVKLIAYDFDGVMTDNKALIFSNGDEAVFINRSDGLAIEKIKSLGIIQVIISTEKTPIVLKRAEKLNIHAINGVNNKLEVLMNYLSKQKDIALDDVAFIGNELNDFDVMQKVGIKISPSDAAKEILELADYITSARGGEGVIREIFGKLVEEN
jgi:3-deoxy-D-manno-octulosonate 8-phosphate phosphatase (KDO 8-P phosphatase)